MIFLTSNLLNYINKDGKKVAIEINNNNNLVDEIKDNLKTMNTILFIASSKDNYLKNEEYSSLLFKSFELSNIIFKNYYVIDGRFNGNLKKLISNSDMIILSGGNTKNEMDFFNEIKLRSFLKEYKGIVLGISAGAINLANDVYNSPENIFELEELHNWQGLGLTNINIEPHFVLCDKDFSNDEKLQRSEVLKESHNRVLYGVTEGSYISCYNGINKVHGLVYIIKNGKIKKIVQKVI